MSLDLDYNPDGCFGCLLRQLRDTQHDYNWYVNSLSLIIHFVDIDPNEDNMLILRKLEKMFYNSDPDYEILALIEMLGLRHAGEIRKVIDDNFKTKFLAGVN